MSSIGAHSFSSGSSCSTRTASASIGSLIFVLYLYVDIELQAGQPPQACIDPAWSRSLGEGPTFEPRLQPLLCA